MSDSIISPELRSKVIGTFPMDPGSIHGPKHWARVEENARLICKETGADIRILELFALFHDSLRQNDIIDKGHGQRGADHAVKLRAEGWYELEDEAFELLREACIKHTDGETKGRPVLITCWDADRLDLWRCGIKPDPTKMCTETARQIDTIEWAMKRSGGPVDEKSVKK